MTKTKTKFKHTEIGWIPEDWEIKKIKDIGKIITGGTPSTKNKNYWNGEIPFVLIEDMTNAKKYIYDTKNKITELGLKNSSAWVVPKNSLLISMYASLGEVVINKIETATNQAILAIILKNDYDLEFLYYLIKFSKNNFEKFVSQTTQKNLNKNKLRNFEIFIPKKFDEQQAIAQVLSDMDKEIDALQKRKNKLTHIKQSAMHLLLTGKVRLIHPSQNSTKTKQVSQNTTNA